MLKLNVVSILCIAMYISPASCMTPEAISLITDAAQSICGSEADAGSAEKVKVTGDLKAELSGLAKKLADLGLSGSGSIEKDSYVGVLQQDLAANLADLRHCKLAVFDSLSKTLALDESKAQASRLHFSETKEILKPAVNEGEDSFTVDNLIQFTAIAPYSDSQVRLVWNAEPIRYSKEQFPGTGIQTLTIFRKAENSFVFSPDKPSHEISAGGRTFIITLLNTGFSSDGSSFKYRFGVSEKQ